MSSPEHEFKKTHGRSLWVGLVFTVATLLPFFAPEPADVRQFGPTESFEDIFQKGYVRVYMTGQEPVMEFDTEHFDVVVWANEGENIAAVTGIQHAGTLAYRYRGTGLTKEY